MGRTRHGLLFTLLLSLGGCADDQPVPSAGAAVLPGDEPDTDLRDDVSAQGVIVEPSVIVDDSNVTVDAQNYAARRRALIELLWGSEGVPATLPVVTKGVPSPVAGLANLRRVDRLRIDMDGGETNLTQHFIAERSNGQLVVMSLGHICKIAEPKLDETKSDVGAGQYRTLRALLENGYSVLVTYMPHMSPEECRTDHNALLSRSVASGHPLKWFLEPVAVSLNYLQQASDDFPKYRAISMLGLSGGGWTTTLYAAIDESVRTSISIAGTVPIYLRAGSSFGDMEQTIPELYEIAGYPDLYVLAATGAGRRHVQLLNRRDNCCFGESASQYDESAHGPWDLAMRDVELEVQKRLAEMGARGGAFHLEIDEAPQHHTISWNALVATILAELDGSLRRVAASSPSHVFVRHQRTLREWTPEAGWADTALRAAGTPAVVTTESGTTLFYRSPSNVLTSATRDAAGWSEESLGRIVISDPVAVAGTGGTVVVSVGPTYKPIVSLPDAAPQQHQNVATSARVAGVPALLRDDDRLTIGARGLDGSLHVIEGSIAMQSSGPLALEWSDTIVPGPVAGFPGAVRAADGSDRFYFRTPTGLVEAGRAAGASSFASSVIDSTAPLSGSPTVSLVGGKRRVYERDRGGSVHTFSFDGAAWTRTVRRAHISDSFAAVGGLLFATDFRGRVVQGDGRAAFLVVGHP